MPSSGPLPLVQIRISVVSPDAAELPAELPAVPASEPDFVLLEDVLPHPAVVNAIAPAMARMVILFRFFITPSPYI